MSPRQRIKNKQEWFAYLNSSPRTGADLNNLRQDCYRDIEAYRKRPLLVYCTKFIPAPANAMNLINIDLSDIDGFTDLINSINDSESIDILIHSPGGTPDATERIVDILRKKFKEVHFLIPHSAYSAATMLALSGNTVTLHPSAVMGPIDPQINGIPSRLIKRGWENVIKKIKDEGPESIAAYMPLIEKYSIDLLELCEDAEELSKILVANWIKDYMLNDTANHAKQLKEAVDYFANYEEHKTHSRPLNISKLKKFDLKISESDKDLSELLWEAHLLVDGFFENTSFVKLFENAHGVSWGRQAQAIQMPVFFQQQPSPQPPAPPPLPLPPA